MGAPKRRYLEDQKLDRGFFHRIGMMQPEADDLGSLDKIIDPAPPAILALVLAIIIVWARPLRGESSIGGLKP